MVTIEEIVLHMPNAKDFSKLNAILGFWQIQLNKDSSKLLYIPLTTRKINIHKDVFWSQLCVGNIPKCDVTYGEDIDSTKVIVDDIKKIMKD